MPNHSKIVAWTGIVLILSIGLIHFIDTRAAFGDATYKGVLFALNGVGGLVAALGIARGARSWGWGLGLLVAGGAFVGYFLSRTVGLPLLPAEPDAWLEPLGITSFLAEGAFVLLALWAFSKAKTRS